MGKKHVVYIIIISVILGWIFNIFPGRTIAAKISTWPVLNRLKILNPQAPIVITNRETIRISDTGDVLQAVNSVKAKVAAVLMVKNGELKLAGNAVNLTSDGIFVTGEPTFEDPGGEYYVLLDDGKMAPATMNGLDSATSLIYFSANLNNVPTAALATSKDLSSGDKVIFGHNGLQNSSMKIVVAYVGSSQKNASQMWNSDFPRRSFWAPVSTPLVSGEAIINMNGDIAGIWNGKEIISSDVLKRSITLYLNTKKDLVRPSFGFDFFQLSANESGIIGKPEGARVSTVLSGSPAQAAGLASGDIITAVDGTQVNENSTLEEILEKYKPGDNLQFVVVRDNRTIQLSLNVTEL